MTFAHEKAKRKPRPLLWLVAMLGAMLLVGVVLSNFQQEVGLAEPSSGARAAVAAATEVDHALSTGADYREFSEALRVALVAHRNMVVSNPADVAFEHMLSNILDCYQATREAWQADIEGAWDAETYGDPSYWRAVHPGLEVLSGSVLGVEDVKRAYRTQASEMLVQALRSVGS